MSEKQKNAVLLLRHWVLSSCLCLALLVLPLLPPSSGKSHNSLLGVDNIWLSKLIRSEMKYSQVTHKRYSRVRHIKDLHGQLQWQFNNMWLQYMVVLDKISTSFLLQINVCLWLWLLFSQKSYIFIFVPVLVIQRPSFFCSSHPVAIFLLLVIQWPSFFCWMMTFSCWAVQISLQCKGMGILLNSLKIGGHRTEHC